MQHLWALSATAYLDQKRQTTVGHYAAWMVVNDGESVTELALEMAEVQWYPVNQGWYDHEVFAEEIPFDAVRQMVAANLREMKAAQEARTQVQQRTRQTQIVEAVPKTRRTLVHRG